MRAGKNNDIKRIFSVFLSVLLIICVGFGSEIYTYATAFQPELYVEDIEVYVCESGDSSASDARKYFEDKGWVFSGIELNPGTGTEMDAWLGYKITRNRAMAIRDIRYMGMDTGYQLYNYREITEYFASLHSGTAQTMYAAAIEFADNYNAGSPKAMDAYKGLNLFRVDSNGEKLGDYILGGNADPDLFVNILTKASTGTLNAVINFLNMGIAPYENEYDDETYEPVTRNWASLVSKSELWAQYDSGMTTDELSELDRQYNDNARELFKRLQEFTTMYENARVRFNAEEFSESEVSDETADVIDDVTEEDADVLYINAYEALNGYKAYADVGLGDFLLGMGRQTSDKVDLKMLYPVVEAMGDNQASIACVSGLLVAVTNLSDNAESEMFDDMVGEARDAIRDYNGSDAVSLWDTADDDIENAKIAYTSDAVRKQTAKQHIGYVSKQEVNKEKFEKAVKIINMVCGIVFVACFVVEKIVVFVMAKLVAAALVNTVLYTVLGYLLETTLLISAVSKWVGTVVLFISIGVMIGIWFYETFIKEKVKDLNHSEKPDYIFDSIDTQYGSENVRYKTVKGRDGKPADLNCSKQYHWVIMAYTKDDRVGSPICADAGGTIFKSVQGSQSRRDGFAFARFFGERSPGNANAFCEHDKVGGCYLHYRTEDSINEEPAGSGVVPDEGDNKDEVPSGQRSYIKNIIIETAKTEIEAKAKILDHEGKYYLLDYNLSPETGIATFLGYNITTDPEQAITDIRVAPYVGISQDAIRFGDINYVRVNIVGVSVNANDSQTRPQCDAVYTTTDKNAGSPIPVDGLHAVRSYAEAQPGWEPVSFFGSDLPYNFNTKFMTTYNAYSSLFFNVIDESSLTCYISNEDNALNRITRVYLYYEPEKKYTEGTKYLSGLFFIGGHDSVETFLAGDYVEYVSSLVSRIRELPNACVVDHVNLSQSLSNISSFGMEHVQSYLCYTWSYNPKRALYNAAVYQGDGFSDSVPYTMSKATDNGTENYIACTFIGQGWSSASSNNYMFRFIHPANAFMNYKGMLLKYTDTRETIENGYTTTLPGNISFGYKKMKFLPTGLYVTGYKEDARPLTLDNIVITDQLWDAQINDGRISHSLSKERAYVGSMGADTLGGSKPQGAFRSVYELKDPNSTEPFNLAYPVLYYNSDVALGTGDIVSKDGSGLYIYISGTKKTKGKYITSLSVGAFSRAQLKAKYPTITDEQLAAADAVADAQALAQATGGCRDEVIVVNITAKNQNNAWYNKQSGGISSKSPPKAEPAAYIGLNRTDDLKNDQAITGILLYKLDVDTAPTTTKVNGVEYYCAGTQVPIEMNGSKYYLYYTFNTSVAPGVPLEEILIDNVPIVSGYATNLCGDKDHDKPYGEPGQTSFIHMKYEHTQGEFFNKLFIGQGSNERAAMCDLLSQGCVEFIDMDLNEGVVGKSIVMGYRVGRPDYEKVREKLTPEAQLNELIDQRKEAVYDIIVTKCEDYHPEGVVVDNIYYSPVSDKDLTAGAGNRLHMYYACTYYSGRYNTNNNADTIMPYDAFSGYITNIGFSRYDRVPYNSELAGTSEGDTIMPWEYVMFSDKSTHVDLNEGTVAFDSSGANNQHAWDNRVNMFAQRSDGSVKPAGEITGGFVGRTMKVGTGYISE